MTYHPEPPVSPVALVTGAAARIGAALARSLHGAGYAVVIHHHRSSASARDLAAVFNTERPASAVTARADLLDLAQCQDLVDTALAWRGRLDLLVNNASSFFPTPLGTTSAAQWDDLMGTNLKAPYFLAQAAHAALHDTGGSIVNLVDIHAERPIAEHPVYCAAKAGLVALTRALARDLAPRVRVNAIAPGAILWPADTPPSQATEQALTAIPLGTLGGTEAIATALAYLTAPGNYVTGQILAVDGGRSLV